MTRSITTTTQLTGVRFESGDYSLDASIAALPAELVTRLAVHGLKQKLADAMAIPRDEKTGASATTDDKFRAAQRVWSNLQSGVWGVERTGEASTNDYIQAISDHRGVAYDVAETWYRALPAKQQAKVRTMPVIMVAVAALRTKRATDAGDAFEGLGD
jgi:predicted oxidoreductase